MKEILVGADPELFVLDDTGRNISCHTFLPGTKKRPHPVKYGAVQVDGTAAEFNIEPAPDKKTFVRNIHEVMAELRRMLPADHRFDIAASVHYDRAYFDTLPLSARRLGCLPDYDAYTGLQMCRPDAEQTMRTAAGHVHIGWTKGRSPFNGRHFQSCRTLVKELDASLGLASVLFDQSGQERRQLYGQAGAFRPKPYGCEYRVLSNAWLKSDELIEYVYDQVYRAIERLEDGGFWCHRAISEENAQDIINNGLAATAERYLDSYGFDMPPGYTREHGKPKKSTKANRSGSGYIKMNMVDESPPTAVNWDTVLEQYSGISNSSFYGESGDDGQ